MTQFPMNPTPQGMGQYQPIQQMFPQPQGTVYGIQSPAEIGNIPIGSTGLSIALCFAENLMYIKSFQNGQPIIMAYRIAPFQKEDAKIEASAPSASNHLEERLNSLEEKLTKIINNGGKFDGLL